MKLWTAAIDRRAVLRATVLGVIGLGTCDAVAATGGDNSRLLVRDLFNKDLSVSPKAQVLAGKRIDIFGYMSPPPVAESDFFVLTQRPLALCPFCDPDAEWPDQVMAIYTRTPAKLYPFNVLLRVRGTLQLGEDTHDATGFRSKIRMRDSFVVRVNR